MLGQSISHYQIVRKLGEGGMGVVYEALDLKLNRPVALKFLNQILVNSREQVVRLQQEALAISALNHPNIATIYDIEEVGGNNFLVLEYLPRGTLRSKLNQLNAQNQQLPLEQALEYAIQIADGLAHAHAHGIIHRDIKSSNILFTADGNPKIADFSIAKWSEGSGTALDSQLMGTPPSMSPEQAQGKDLDHRSDIFSFGIVLFEMFTGQMPFRGARMSAVLHEIIHAPAPALSQFRNGIPPSLESITSQVLAKDRDKRYQSMSALAADLRLVQKELESRERQFTALETVTMPAQPRRRWLGWKMGIPLLLAVTSWIVLEPPSVRQTAANWVHLNSIPAEKRLAVLKFVNAGATPELSDGLMDIVSSKLTQVEQFQGSLLVISPAEIRKAEVETPSDARKAFGATLAITGTVQRLGDHLEVMMNLVETKTLTQLRSVSIETEYPDPAALQESLVAKATEMLDIALSPSTVLALQAGNTPVPAAYRWYVEGRGYLQRFNQTDRMDKAIALFQKAIQLDPKYALAYAGMGEAWLEKFKVTRDPESIKEAFSSSSRALELQASLVPVRITMGQVLLAKGQYEEAEQQFQNALKIDPISAEAHRGLARAYDLLGRRVEAEQTYKQAIRLRPKDWTGYRDLGAYYFNNGPVQDAEQYYKEVVKQTPGNYSAHNDLGAAYLRMGRYSEATAELEKSVAIKPVAMNHSNLGSLYYLQGRYKDAALSYERAVAATSTNSSWWGNLADAYRFTPELSRKAPEAYRKAIAHGERELSANLRDARLRSRIAYYYAALGDKDPALSAIAEARRISPSNGYVLYRAGLVYEQVGDRERAIKSLQAARQAHYPIEEIRRAPTLKSLREDPRYALLVDSR